MQFQILKPKFQVGVVLLFAILVPHRQWLHAQSTGDDPMQIVRQYQQQRVDAIERVVGSVIAIYGDDRAGGGSGVIISASGLALTNHHVIIGAGTQGWGGLAGDRMFPWKLVGTDPGGDVSLIQLEGDEPFPWSPLGDSDLVRVGDWALAMGNPFLLTEDQSPTVTLGIVSGVKRYQYGAGKNQLVYGNCIQVDSSINPGNSGGPLFNFAGEVIGINGRGSFRDRGRVNVGLGYAISANQIKNFIPDLMATKLTEHGTLDANFSDRQSSAGAKVVCSTLNTSSPAAVAGLALGDELVEFEGTVIKTANQFTNLICTLPESWPANLKLQTPTGQIKDITVRLRGLPYAKPKTGRMQRKSPPKLPPGLPEKPGDNKETPPDKKEIQRQRKLEMLKLLSSKPGTVRNAQINRQYTTRLLQQMRSACGVTGDESKAHFCQLIDMALITTPVGRHVLRTTLAGDGRWLVEQFEAAALNEKRIKPDAEATEVFLYDGETYFRLSNGDQEDGKIRAWTVESLSPVEAKLQLPMLQAIAITGLNRKTPLESMGTVMLDGSDRCGRSNAYRFRIKDKDQDPLFLWTLMQPLDASSSGKPCKISASLDCLEGGVAAGVTLEDWETVGNLAIPLSRNFIAGLDEEVSVKLKNLQATSVDKAAFEQMLNDWTKTVAGKLAQEADNER